MSTILSLHSLELWTRIGVPERERAIPQRILVTVSFELFEGKAGGTDDLTNTVDYEGVWREMCSLAKRERKTLEKLGEDIAAMILAEKKAKSVRVELRKFVLPGTESVSVTLVRP